MGTALQLSNGLYKFRRKRYTFRRVQLAAWRHGIRYLVIRDAITGTVLHQMDLL